MINLVHVHKSRWETYVWRRLGVQGGFRHGCGNDPHGNLLQRRMEGGNYCCVFSKGLARVQDTQKAVKVYCVIGVRVRPGGEDHNVRLPRAK